MKSLFLAAVTATLAASAPAAAQAPAKLTLTRLDCGDFLIKDYNAFFSDTMAYPSGQPKRLTSSCYLIRHGDQYLLWDTGVAEKFTTPEDSSAQTISLKRTLLDQLAQLGVRPDQIKYVGISHFHADHIGQSARFPKAQLVIGAADIAALRAVPPAPGLQPELLAPWIKGGAKIIDARGDVDFFHDGRVVMVAMPGHTPGHFALLVRLASGPVLLSGDQYHFTEQVANRGVPGFNTSRADTLASHDRFDRLAANLKAKVIIQHEPADIAKLPQFPAAAE
ncbi:MAG: N-acyl homoserine lactonase family protein [Pseudomonadota bacterium]|nr:N-acyl homoserine lactonase family protein [Pseudomonadota bacterium]